MQIHEITQRRVDEGMWDSMRDGLGAIKTGYQQGGLTGAAKASVSNTTMNQAGQQRLQKQAAKASDKLTAQGYGASQQQPSDNWEDKYKALQQNPGVMSYAKNLAAGWAKNGQAEIGKTTVNNTPPATTKKTVATTKKTVATTKKPAAGAGVFGQMANHLSTTYNPNTLHEADATVVAAPNANQIKTAFVNWSDSQLATRVPETGETITMDTVRKTAGLSDNLKSALDKVASTQGTPAQAAAVEEYIKLAVAGVQALAQSSKNGVSAQFAQQNIATTAGAGSVTQALQASGINTQSLQKFGAAAKQAGSSMQVKMTADPFLNNLAKQAGYTLTR
jgi:hypothetical protein